MRGNERRRNSDVFAMRNIQFPIPMRGNEFRLQVFRFLILPAFPIPMRGNEPFRELGELVVGKFPIPMRGNEILFLALAVGAKVVPDPYEG